MVFFQSSLLTGVEASAARNAPVTKTCMNCGAILPSSVRVCDFCDSSFTTDPASLGDPSASRTQGNLALKAEPGQEAAWRGELAHRLEAYRARRRKAARNSGQSRLPFADSTEVSPAPAPVVGPDPPLHEAFSFAISLGPRAPKRPSLRM